MMFTLCYGCGLRLSELLAVKVSHIDGERRVLCVEQGKGAKDRLMPLSELLLVQLRRYWRGDRPRDWLFPGQLSGRALCATSVQKVYTETKRQAGVHKVGGIHALRHPSVGSGTAGASPTTVDGPSQPAVDAALRPLGAGSSRGPRRSRLDRPVGGRT